MLGKLLLATVCLVLVSGCGTSPVRQASDVAPKVIYAFDVPPKAIYLAQPTYPLVLLEAGVTGQVLVELVVTRSGAVTDVHAVRATHPLFADAAMEAIRRCKYLPGTKAGDPVDVRMQLPLSFDLE